MKWQKKWETTLYTHVATIRERAAGPDQPQATQRLVGRRHAMRGKGSDDDNQKG